MAARRQDGRNQSGIAAPTGGRAGSWAQGPARSWWVGFMSLYTWARIVPRVRCMEACVGEMDTDIKPLAQRNSLVPLLSLETRIVRVTQWRVV